MILRRWSEPEHLALLKLVHGEAIRGGEAARTYARSHVSPMSAWAAEVFEGFIREGKIRAIDPEHAVKAFVGPLMLMMMHQHMLGISSENPAAARAFLHSHVDIFLHGIAR
jgi:hypothetical protein